MDFGIKPSGLRKAARFEMTGVSSALTLDPEKPHAVLVHHLGVSNPAVMNAIVKGIKPADVDPVTQLIERGGITFENLAADPSAENLASYFAQLVETGYGLLVLQLFNFASDAKNYEAATTDPVALGGSSPPG